LKIFCFQLLSLSFIALITQSFGVIKQEEIVMLRFITHHWAKLGIFAVLYIGAFASLGTLTSVQLDAMQNHMQPINYRPSNP
jgi:hypothetical protein